MSYNVLLIDDDKKEAAALAGLLQDEGQYNVLEVASAREAIDLLNTDKATDIDLVLLDLHAADMSEVDVLNAVKPLCPDLPFIVRTGSASVDLVVEAMKAGASDFIRKTDSAELLLTRVNSALREQALRSAFEHFGIKDPFGNMAATSDAARGVISLAKKAAASAASVLLRGGAGVGKDHLAYAIHVASERAKMPFITVNCHSLSDKLVEGVIFGHEKGAYKGALYSVYGKLREADGGTLLLSAVESLSLEMQEKLLQVLRTNKMRPVGADNDVKVNIRFMFATRCDLAKRVKQGSFREDLYYRINVLPIDMADLSDRREDVLELAMHFCSLFAAKEQKNIKGFTDRALDALSSCSWPGNVRRLRNRIYRAVTLCGGEMIDVKHLPDLPVSSSAEGSSASWKVNLVASDGNMRSMEDIEKDVIKAAIMHYKGHMSNVANHLGIGRSTLYRKIDAYGIRIRSN